MIYLAYDGSLNGNWVSRYAIQLASHASERTLHLIHIQDESLSSDALHSKIENIDRECRARDVELLPRIFPKKKDVIHSLTGNIPHGGETVVICGTRVRQRRKAFLFGTVSEKLLRTHPFNVLAIRVVQPGLLGNPHDFLLPLAGHPRGLESAWPFLRMFIPEMRKIHMLRGMVVSRRKLRRLSARQIQDLRRQGIRYLARLSDELWQGRGQGDFHLDTRILVCDDWVAEILLQASSLKSHIILLGATERVWLHRVTHGNELERILRKTPCDVGIYRSA